MRDIVIDILKKGSWPGTFPGPGRRPSGRECNRSSISVAFVPKVESLHHYLECLCSQKYQKCIRKYTKIEPKCLTKLGITYLVSPKAGQYHTVTDNADETLLGPLTLREAIVPNNANEPKVCSLAPPPLPEYLVEVLL